jgi:predicted Zn finger-like uncharacterized protein
MIEIQCTSCHTRYRIDERVLPADNPTFKCSRCGHVFTTDPVAAKKAAAQPAPSSRPQAPRVSPPRTDPKPEATPTATATPKAPAEEAKPVASEEQTAAAKPHPISESKPAPIKPYIRNQRPTMFDRTPEAAAAKPSAEPPPRASEAPRPPATSRAAQNIEADDMGENLEFDFSDEMEPELGSEPDDGAATAPERWSVGEDALDTPPARQPEFGRGEADPGFSRDEPAPIGRGTISAGSPPMQRSPLPDERAYIERAGLHSARTFIGLFFVVALMFVALTLVIYGIPSASAELMRRMPVIGPEFEQPMALENLVSVSDVQSNYQTVKGGHDALVVTGVVKNNATVPLHTVQIGVRLLDASQHDVAGSAVYVGTTLSPRMIGEMTPHELEFLQKLDPQKTFILEPGHAAPFMMVFIDPPRNLNHFAVAVSKAQPPAAIPSGQASVRP